MMSINCLFFQTRHSEIVNYPFEGKIIHGGKVGNIEVTVVVNVFMVYVVAVHF